MIRPINLLKFVATFGWGGTERQFVNLALGLDASRFTVHFGCLRRFGVMLDEIEASGIAVRHYDVTTFRNIKVVAAQYLLARDIRRLGIQIVHTYGFYSNVFAIPAAKLAGARVVASIRDMGVYLSPSQRIVQRWICRFADHVLVNGNAIKDWLTSDGYDGDRITVIPNGIDLSRFEQSAHPGRLRSELGLAADTPLIGVVGRLNRLKGLEDFLTAAAIVARRFPKARFLIMGESSFVPKGSTIVIDESYRDKLSRLAVQLGLQDRVVFTGFRPDVERILPDLSVSVLPSLSEGLSNTLLESMAAGVPVVATRVGGAAEAVQDGHNGLLVPAADPNSLANAICRLLDEPVLASRLGQAARRRIIDRYSMSRMVESTSQIYETLLEHPSRAKARSSLNPI